MSEADILAHVLAGEASVCGFWAMVGIAYAYTTGRAGPFYGWQSPSPLAVWVALFYEMYPDPTPAARYFFSREDLAKPAVQRIVAGRGPPLTIFDCQAGLQIYVFP